MGDLDAKRAVFARHAQILRDAFQTCAYLQVPRLRAANRGVFIPYFSSVQLEIVKFSADMVAEFVTRAGKAGIPISHFGGAANGFMSTLKDWRFADPKNA